MKKTIPINYVSSELTKLLRKCEKDLGDVRSAVEIIFFLTGQMILENDGSDEFDKSVGLVKKAVKSKKKMVSKSPRPRS